MDRSFLKASVPDLIKQLTVEEKTSLLAGRDWWKCVHPYKGFMEENVRLKQITVLYRFPG